MLGIVLNARSYILSSSKSLQQLYEVNIVIDINSCSIYQYS